MLSHFCSEPLSPIYDNVIIQFLSDHSHDWLYTCKRWPFVIFVHVMFISICLGLSYEPLYHVYIFTTEWVHGVMDQLSTPLRMVLTFLHTYSCPNWVYEDDWWGWGWLERKALNMFWRRWQRCIKTYMVMLNGSLEATLALRYDTLGFTMEAEATLDGYGRSKSNQCCNKTKHLYIKFHTIQEPGLTARYWTHIVNIMGQWCVGHSLFCGKQAY